jgi:2-polyprenyl-3-methyl-5-hydroxy-6-metoxy-1,4-benzoquinol methylase
MTRGTQGYAESAPELIERYEAIGFAEKHRAALAFIPAAPSRVLDIGAGTGSDATWLASRGHRVIAVEPTEKFRSYARARHPSPRIEWVDDCLPKLEFVVKRQQAFDLILLTAVWMHLDVQERVIAMPILASLLPHRGVMIMSLRHGPVPSGRVMFEVSPEETIAAAKTCGLSVLLDVRSASTQAANREAGVTWSQLAFMR